MPLFTYECEGCGLRFGAMARNDESDTVCKRCKGNAKKQLSTPAFTFAHRPNAPVPQNTGASMIDHDVDVVIGRAAACNLREFERRQDYKRRLMSRHCVEGQALSRLDDGDYFVMSDEQRRAAKRARILDQDVMKRIQAWKAQRSAFQGDAS